MNRMINKFICAAILTLAGAMSAQATVITSTLASIDGPYMPSGFPIDLGSYGAFTYNIPTNAVINSASLSGTYGTSQYAYSTASFDAIIDGVQMTICGLYSTSCYYGGSAFRGFSFDLSSLIFPSLMDGSASLQIIQTSGSFVRFGSPTLNIDFAESTSVPEPTTLLMLVFGFIAMRLATRRSKPATA